MNIEQRKEKIEKLTTELKELEKETLNEIKEEIKNIPELEGVKRKTSNIVIVPSSMLLGNPWSPSFFNTEEGKKKVLETIETINSLDELKKNFNIIIKNKKINDTFLNGNIINKLKEILVSI